MQQLTRAQIRERVRGMLGILTPVQNSVPSAVEGDQPPWRPDPSNTTLNNSIEQAIALINRKVGFSSSGADITIDISAQTANGGYTVDLGAAIGSSTVAGQINNISHIRWLPDTDTTSTGSILLKQTSFETLDRDQKQWSNLPVATPEWVVVDAYQLTLLPGPNVDGAIYFKAGLSLISPASDSQYIGQLPNDYVPVVIEQVCIEVMKQMIGDMEMQGRLKVMAVPDRDGQLITPGIHQMVSWYQGQLTTFSPTFKHKNHRRGYANIGRTR